LHRFISPHTDTSVWTQVEDPSKLKDKDLVYCWDDSHEKVPPEIEGTMDWVEEARKSLED